MNGETKKQAAPAAKPDTPPPPDLPTVDITSPANGVILTGTSAGTTINVSGEASALNDTVTKVEVQLGDQSWQPAKSGSANWSTWSFSGTVLKRGPLVVTAKVWGASKKTSTAKVTVTVSIPDKTPPVVQFISPQDGAVVSGPNNQLPIPVPGTITGTAQDPPNGAEEVSGVKQVECRLDGALLAVVPKAATDWSSWSAGATIPLGTHTVTAHASDSAGNVSADVRLTVTAIDTTPPGLAITSPPNLSSVPDTAAGSQVLLQGTAQDVQTGVKLVEWSLDGGPFTPATPVAAGWSTWSAVVTIPHIPNDPTLGRHRIDVRCSDNANPANVATQGWTIYVAFPYVAQDGEGTISLGAYVQDLLAFAGNRVKTSANFLKLGDLTGAFYQPFDQLQADAEVHEVRIGIEVLRAYLGTYLKAHPPNDRAPLDKLRAAEAAYRQSAYQTLLLKLGTSYEEIRLARSADDSTRQALAGRLGIDLAGSRPDELDQLLIQPNQVTEPAMEKLFGLADTTRPPLSDRPAVDWLAWQRKHLRTLWRRQDHPADPGANPPPPIVDPDLLTEADLIAPAQPNLAYDLWKTRGDWIKGQLSALAGDKKPGETVPARFDRLVQGTLGPVADLLALDTQRQKGNNIEAQLAQKQLSPEAFSYLVRLRNLAATQSLLDAEWTDLYSILVQVQKLRKYGDWRAAEAALTIGPDYFQSPAVGKINGLYSTGLDANGSPLPDGAADPNWAITAAPSGSAPARAYATNNSWPVGGPWMANSSASRWLSAQADEKTGDPPGIYTYKTTFDLTGFDPASARITVRVAVDNDLTDMRLNGQGLGLKASGFGAFTPLAVNGAFAPGANTLEFVVKNGGTAPNPSGLRVELSGTATAFPPQLPPWRATGEARRAWQDTLQARINQEQMLAPALQGVVESTEEATLPLLRDALVAAVSSLVPQDVAELDAANWLTQRLLIDIQASGRQKTTRLTQVVESVQGLLFALRNNRFREMGPPLKQWDLFDDRAQFDQEWEWMGSYAMWRSAMLAFLYPENLLYPTLRRDGTDAFKAFVENLRGNTGLTAEQARQAAQAYLHQLRVDVGKSLPGELKDANFVLTDQLDDKQLGALRALVRKLWPSSASPPPAYLQEVFYFVPVHLALQLQQAGQFAAALDWLWTVYAYELPLDQRKIYYGLVLEEAISSAYQRTDRWLLDGLDPHGIAQTRANAYTCFTVMTVIRCLLDFADAEFTRDTAESLPRARALYLSALELLNLDELNPAGTGFAPNPIPGALRQHADLNLFKLRDGRNIAGMRRSGEPSFPQSVAIDNLPSANSQGQIAPPGGSSARQPTPYRYTVLIERAKQLVTLAQQIEDRYLTALEKVDAESYTLLKAGQDLDLARASVQLQDLKVGEADDSVNLATIQQTRAQIQVDHYQDLLKQGVSGLELASLGLYGIAAGLQLQSAELSFASAILPSSVSVGTDLSVSYSPQAIAGALASQSSAQAAANSTNASIQATLASYERRRQEWEFQQSLAQQDVAIGAQQVVIATDQRRVVGQEHYIATLQDAHAQAVVDFLHNKFTNVELYQWVSGILGRVYSYFLQQATAIARLAQDQVAFERQEKPLSFIKSDYWQAPAQQAGTGGSAGGTATDRRGLTGSARLLQDIYQVDQFAFNTNKRKLQLSKTISLARLDPFQFQRFQETGVLPFATPMRLFDQDFPGHYLRLIKRVRTTVIALIPPNQGIRATLAATGVSRVTVGDVVFQTIVVRRDPELVALSSPQNATGVFELDPQSDMLLPFEAMGVDTSWELQMPRAANPFDYSTIADVLITVEYTALNSVDYRQQVIRQLDRTVGADRPYSFRNQFPDQWYYLNNPEQATPPAMTVAFRTEREDFPPNLDDLMIQHLLLHFPRADGKSFEVTVGNLSLTQGGTKIDGGGATSIDGVLSTRRGSAPNWRNLFSGKAPVGDWELSFNPDDRQLRDRFKNEEITDVLFVITYSARTPEWPA
jgi:hypothetical protein